MRLFKEKLSLLVVIFKCTLHAYFHWKWKKVRSNSYPKSEQVKPDRQREAKRRKAANIPFLPQYSLTLVNRRAACVFASKVSQIPKENTIQMQTFESAFILFISEFFYLRFFEEENEFFKAKLYSTFHFSLEVISLHLPLFTKPDFWLVWHVLYLF